jgi:hypothetical protein
VSSEGPAQEGGSTLQGHIRRRGPSGSWEYILDVGRYGAQRCQGCNRRFWIERRPKQVCPACGGELCGNDRATGPALATLLARCLGFDDVPDSVVSVARPLVRNDHHDAVGEIRAIMP